MNMTTQINTYGKCPQCGGEGLTRERRPNGNDKCVNGHTYPSASALSQPNEPVAIVHKNSAGQITIRTKDDEYFDVSKYVGCSFYTAPQKTSELEQANKLLEARCNTLEVNLSVIEGGLDAHNAMDKALREVDANTIADLTAKLEKMREAICIYSREMLGDINFESDEQAINYMLSFTEENPHGEALEECK